MRKEANIRDPKNENENENPNCSARPQTGLYVFVALVIIGFAVYKLIVKS